MHGMNKSRNYIKIITAYEVIIEWICGKVDSF
jgi:hypothetical protein